MKKIKRNHKKNRKRSIIYKTSFVIIILSIFYLFTYSVKAGQNDSELVKNYTGHYVYVNFNNQDHGYNVIRYTMNNKTVYCIELGTDITSYTYNSTDDLQSSGLTEEQIKYIKLLSYYGYDYKDHNKNIKYYMATQELIWSYLNKNITFKWIESKTEPNNILNIETEKQDILNLIETHLKTPLIPENIKVKVGNSIIVEDKNKVINNYYIEENKYITAQINGNSLIITPNNKYVGIVPIIIKEKEEYNDKSTLYYYDNSQKMISAGTIEPNTISSNITIEGAIIYFQKYDKDNNSNQRSGEATLYDAEYKVYDEYNNNIGLMVTNSNGLSTISGIPFGKYYFKESKPSQGYLINENVEEVVVDKAEVHYITYEQVIKSKIEIFKMYGYDNENYQIPEPNITFNIYNKKNELYKTVTTDNKGYTEFELPYGTYTIKQLNTTNGYNKVDDIKLTIDENSEKTIRYNLLDKDMTTYLKIIKLDSRSELPILNSHASFKIKNLDTNNYISYKNNEIFETNDEGYVIMPVKIPYGEYEIEEIEPPKNYQKDKKITITINEQSNFYYDDNYGSLYDIKLLNTLNTSTLNIIKDKEVFVPKNNNYKYEFIKSNNSNLELYANKDIITPDGVKQYNKNDIVKTLVTDNQGKITINNLYYGEYCIKELDVDINYLKNKDTCFNLEEDNTTIFIHNYLKKGKIKIIKTDGNTGIFLKNAIIELYTNDNILINTSITNDKGIINIENIPLGNYYLKEKKAPDNYNIDNNKYYLKLEYEDKELPIYLTNYKEEDIKPPHTNIIKSKNNIIIILVIIIILLIIKKILNHNNKR